MHSNPSSHIHMIYVICVSLWLIKCHHNSCLAYVMEPSDEANHHDISMCAIAAVRSSSISAGELWLSKPFREMRV